MMRLARIAVLPGNGIGRKVVAEGIKALRAVEDHLEGVRFELREFSAGTEAFLRSGEPMSEKTWEAGWNADAVLLGAMGLPEARWSD